MSSGMRLSMTRHVLHPQILSKFQLRIRTYDSFLFTASNGFKARWILLIILIGSSVSMRES